MITKELIEKALTLLQKRTTNYEYFFSQLQSPDWIASLKEKGYFKKPPAPIKEGDYINFPFWPESQYLSRVADKAPNRVLEIALQVGHKTTNFRVHIDFNDAASKMPPEAASKWAKSEAKWIRNQQYVFHLSDSFIKLVNYLSENEYIKDATNLLSAILYVIPSEENDEEKHDLLRRKPYRLRVDIYEYEKVLKECIPLLAKKGKKSCLLFLCELLINTLSKDKEHKDELSMIWRPAIEENEQNRNCEEIEALQITSIRDIAEELICKKGKEILDILESYNSSSILRISLYLRTKYSYVDKIGTEELIRNEKILDSVMLHHEIYHLLEKTFDLLEPATKESYLKYAMNKDLPDNYAEWFKGAYGKEFSEEDASRHKMQLKYKRLYPVRNYLEGENRSFFTKCVKEFGELDHPDFEFYISAGWCGPTSPKDAKSLDSMSISELIDFLQNWQPKGEIFDDTLEGLGRQLSESVKSNPTKYASIANIFKTVDSTYVRSLLFGFREAIRNNSSFDWKDILTLCTWIISQPVKIEGRTTLKFEKDPDWQWTRKEIASLLEEGLKSRKGEIPVGFRKSVWNVLKVLAEDIEPSPDYERRYGGSNMDPAMLSINTTRGIAMHAVIHYALWFRRDEERKKGENMSFDTMPEVRSCLEKHLDISNDPSLAVRSVYGQYFPWLILLDEEWCKGHLDQIFIKEDGYLDYYYAAWFTYLAFCQPYNNTFRILEPEYEYAIDNPFDSDRVALRLAKPQDKLAEHIMIFYLRGIITIKNNSIIDRLFKKHREQVKKHALEFLGRCLKNEGLKMSPDSISRAKDLWDWRISELGKAKALKDSLELQAFDGWFGANVLEAEWVIERILKVLEHQEIKLDYRITERFSNLIDESPLNSLKCLERLIERDKNKWGFYDYKDHVKMALQKALDSKNNEMIEKSKRIIDILAAKGNLNYRLLLN